MKTLSIFLILILASCSTVAYGKDTAAIELVLDQLHQSAANANGEQYFSLFSDDAIYIGTDAAETWTIEEFKAFAKPYFSKGKGWLYTPTQRSVRISRSGEVAWFVELLNNEKYGTSRGTGVLERRNDQWKIAQYHLTFPLPNELAGKITSEIKQFEKAKN